MCHWQGNCFSFKSMVWIHADALRDFFPVKIQFVAKKSTVWIHAGALRGLCTPSKMCSCKEKHGVDPCRRPPGFFPYQKCFIYMCIGHLKGNPAPIYNIPNPLDPIINPWKMKNQELGQTLTSHLRISLYMDAGMQESISNYMVPFKTCVWALKGPPRTPLFFRHLRPKLSTLGKISNPDLGETLRKYLEILSSLDTGLHCVSKHATLESAFWQESPKTCAKICNTYDNNMQLYLTFVFFFIFVACLLCVCLIRFDSSRFDWLSNAYK